MLPAEVLRLIFLHLCDQDQLVVGQVCHSWRRAQFALERRPFLRLLAALLAPPGPPIIARKRCRVLRTSFKIRAFFFRGPYLAFLKNCNDPAEMRKPFRDVEWIRMERVTGFEWKMFGKTPGLALSFGTDNPFADFDVLFDEGDAPSRARDEFAEKVVASMLWDCWGCRLSRDLIRQILSNLDFNDAISALKVCQKWNGVGRDSRFWMQFLIKEKLRRNIPNLESWSWEEKRRLVVALNSPVQEHECHPVYRRPSKRHGWKKRWFAVRLFFIGFVRQKEIISSGEPFGKIEWFWVDRLLNVQWKEESGHVKAKVNCASGRNMLLETSSLEFGAALQSAHKYLCHLKMIDLPPLTVLRVSNFVKEHQS